jgi:hypothetical protein
MSSSLCVISNDRGSLGLQASDRGEKMRLVLLAEHRGRLVEDQQAHLVHQRLDDLDALLVRDIQSVDAHAFVESEAEPSGRMPHAGSECAAVEPALPEFRQAERDVVERGERRG